MNQRRNKRKLRAHLVFVYSLMIIAIVCTVAVLILVIQGYRYNRYDGKIEQGGLVQFDSRPSGATVSTDGINLTNKTASKITLSSGQHTVMIARDGYGSWTHNLTVKPGSVTWLNYALLYPNNPEQTAVAAYGNVTSVLPSRDNKRMAVVTDTAGVIQLTSLDTAAHLTEKITIAAESYTTPAEGEHAEFTLLSWDKDNKYVLVRYMHGDTVEYLSVKVDDGTTRNLTKGLGVDIASAVYSPSDSNIVYILTKTHELRSANLSEQTLSGILAANVGSFSITERNTLLYATLPDEKGARTISYLTSGASKTKVLKSYLLDASAALSAVNGNYYGDHYVVINHGDMVEILRGDLPNSGETTTVTMAVVGSMELPGGAAKIGFTSGADRIVYAQRDATVVTYDLELDRSARVTLAAPTVRGIDWIDGYHIGTTAGGSAVYSDYDGTNSVSIATTAADLPIVLASGDKYLYYFTTVDGSTSLMRAKMTATN